MMVSERSIVAYHELKNKEENGLFERQEAVLDCIRRYPGMSAREIAMTLTRENENNGNKNKVTTKNVCSRIYELIDQGKIQVYGEKKDRFTNRTVRKFITLEMAQ